MVLLGVVGAAAVFVAAMGWLSPSEDLPRSVQGAAPTSGRMTPASTATIEPATTTIAPTTARRSASAP